MNYIVLELQTNAEGTTSVITTVYDNKEQAESKYHQILMYAAVGSLFIHGAAIILSDGTPYMNYSYRRDEVFNEEEPEETIEPQGE